MVHRFEHRNQPLASRRLYYRRVGRYLALSMAIILGSLAIGILGYHLTEGFSWLDSLLNASMILGGMGPVNPVQTTAGKVFASFYALFSGLVFIGVTGILLAAPVHRLSPQVPSWPHSPD